jgi:hypothetical protein
VIYVLTETDFLSTGDNAVVYRGEDQTDIVMIFTVLAKGTYGDYYCYMVGDADYESVFNQLDYYYSGELNVEGMEFNQSLNEELAAQVMRSAMYARFNAAATAFSGTKSGEYVYQLKETPKPQISYKADGKTIYFTIKVVAEFERKNTATQEADSAFTVTMEFSTELEFDLVAQIDGLEKVSMVADVSNTTKVKLLASVDDEYENTKEFNYFKELFDQAKQTGSYSEIDPSSASAQKEIPIGNLPVAGIPGITLSVNVTNVFNFEAVGELGVDAQLDVNAKFGLQYVKGKGVSAIKSFDAEARVSLYMMGKIKVSDTLKVELNVNALTAGIHKNQRIERRITDDQVTGGNHARVIGYSNIRVIPV